MSMPLEIKSLAVPDVETGSLFTRASFREALAKEFKLKVVDIVFPLAGNVLHIPAFWRKGLLGEKQIVIGAGFDKTGTIEGLDSYNYAHCMGELLTSLADHNIKQLSVRSTNVIPCQPDQSDKVELKISLETSCAQRFKKFSRSTRRNIKQPFKRGFNYSTEKNEYQLEQFYQLYLLQMHQIGSLPLSYHFFQKIFNDNQEYLHLFVGYMDAKPVIASLNFEDGTELYGAWMGVDPDYKKHGLFLCMLWEILEQCEQAGKQYYNLGRSSLESGSYAFKERLADEIHKIYYYDIALQSFRKNSANSLYKSASWIIRNSPPIVMNSLSRTLLSHFY